MTPGQRAAEREAIRKEMHERFNKISPEERRDFNHGMDGMGEKCDMPPEDCPQWH